MHTSCCAPCTHTHTIAVCLAHTCAHNCMYFLHTCTHTCTSLLCTLHTTASAHHCYVPCTYTPFTTPLLCTLLTHTHTPFAVYLAHTVHSCWCALHIHTHTMSSLPPLPRALGSPRAPDLVGSKARFSPLEWSFLRQPRHPAGEASPERPGGLGTLSSSPVSVHQSS